MRFLLNATAKDLLCSANECLAWIFVIINFMTIFYLAFCMFYKFDKVVKTIGYVWLGLVAVGSTLLVALHTCIFTIICTVFTMLLVFAALYVLLKNKVAIIERVERKQEKTTEKPAETTEIATEEVENYEGKQLEMDAVNDYFAELPEGEEVFEDDFIAGEEMVESAPESYIFDDETGKIIENAAEPNVVAEVISEQAQETEQEPEKEEPKVEEMIMPVKNKFTDIIVSQIEEIPEYEEVNKSREELIRELENRPVMVKYQQVNFNQEVGAKPKETKKKQKKQIVESDKLTINRGYQINKIPTD